MSKKSELPRRNFLKQAAMVVGASTQGTVWPTHSEAQDKKDDARSGPMNEQALGPAHTNISYPRVFEGRQLKMIAFPLGGVGAGSIRLGGRGQLRDWEIFNRPNKNFSPAYAFPALWVQSGDARPVTRVL